MNLLKVLKITGNTALQLGPGIVGVIYPALGPIAAAVANQVVAAEAKIGTGKGQEKKSLVMDSLPMMIPLVESLIGRDIVKDEEFTAGVEKLIDAVVTIMNSLNSATPAPAPTVVVVPKV